ncbi:MAG: hypothetical protein RI513_03705 [Balneolaceae bacterium]|nr:hypothetical protein [Balneolaceae bacterium]MDR9446378.1 hypothetical protein [Balneolaceae bacterium]
MDELNAQNIYFMFSVGLFVGYIVDLIMGQRAIGTIGNLLSGAASSIIIGSIMTYFEIFGPLVYAGLGTAFLLFLVNVFSLHSEEEETNPQGT